ncbi:hypothetical protein KKC_08957 [Listeria fleischmannii subsp. coloradonensis]|uniref:DUF3958 family protein n=1 Tax=Listeria fleischmannii TaxID=1069827 RepID=UPI000254F6E2|nr:DUF3958 family protein [Listeria fleischmannii]EIA20082.1 hypothetical protein KKC_08957 [Listeria fleischmannii subsp. coloradonensis]
METWQKLHDSEQEWLAKEEKNSDIKRQLEQLHTEYEEHFKQGLRFIQRLEERFQQSENPHIYRYAMDDMLHVSREVFGDLEGIEKSLKNELQAVVKREMSKMSIDMYLSSSDGQATKNEY